MKLQEFACPNCHAPLVPIKDARYMFCDYCGTRIVIDDIDYYREDSKTERKRIQAEADVRKSSVEKDAEVELQRMKHKENVLALIGMVVIIGGMLLTLILGELMGLL